MVSLDEGWIMGEQGIILRYTDGVWRIVSSPTPDTLANLAMVSPGEGWAVGNRTILYYRR
jgi:photosystem II stability/assembly factor-like uncharacterized protein